MINKIDKFGEKYLQLTLEIDKHTNFERCLTEQILPSQLAKWVQP